ncbi:MAG: hypothetical protein JOY92_15575 [Verrucomicrobia bacterium]|nr:hypothetical protein [Verrucomicrobiota bacterium]
MHNRHAWTQKLEDGCKREVRAIKQGGSWRFQSKRADQERWTYYDEPLLDDLTEFREILFRKYQRRRAAYEDVVWADRELGRLRNEAGAAPADAKPKP